MEYHQALKGNRLLKHTIDVSLKYYSEKKKPEKNFLKDFFLNGLSYIHSLRMYFKSDIEMSLYIALISLLTFGDCWIYIISICCTKPTVQCYNYYFT